MKIKVNRNLLPIKAHFFFFFAALGPILPQLNVFGKQLGVSPAAMGLVTAALPLLWAAAKPLFGYVVDYWPNHRKMVFMLLIVIMTGSYCGLWFIPMPAEEKATEELLEYVYKLNDSIHLQKQNDNTELSLEKYRCHWSCDADSKFEIYLSNSTQIGTIYVDDLADTCSLLRMDAGNASEGDVVCKTRDGCNLICFDFDDEGPDLIDANARGNVTNTTYFSSKTKRDIHNNSTEFKTVYAAKDPLTSKDIQSKVLSKVIHVPVDLVDDENGSFYITAVFWAFVVLMCVGTVAFNVANCIGDAVCFDVLGPDGGSRYGAQRAWGTAGYGATALLGGWLVDKCSRGTVKDFTPAFVLALGATAVDLYSCRKLNLPALSPPSDSGRALRAVLKMPRVLVFILFAVVAGTFDSFIIYYMFWFLEELAADTGSMGQIKLIEGVVVAGQSFIGEILFFALSGRILKRWGYGATMTFSLFCYGVRMMLISFIRHPWHLVFVESIMQGPTYALCYSTIVGYAARVAPAGYSATVQGVVAGMDDGVGFALGSLLGGLLYTSIGGRSAFRVLAGAAVAAAALHAIFHKLVTRPDDEKTPTTPPEEGEKMLQVLDQNNAIYKDTVHYGKS